MYGETLKYLNGEYTQGRAGQLVGAPRHKTGGSGFDSR